MLEHEADIALADAVRQRVLAVELHLALVGPFEARDDAQQRGLARAGRPEQRDQLARADVELDLLERGEVAEALGDVADGDLHRFNPLPHALSSAALATSVTSASSASSDATANAAAN